MAQVKRPPPQKPWSILDEDVLYDGIYIIPVVGPIGAGKSTFINLLAQERVVDVGEESIDPCTLELRPVEISQHIINEILHPALGTTHQAHMIRKKRLIMVDTPGFDDTKDGASAVWSQISSWLTKTYGAGAQVVGVIYLQDITQKRMTGTPKQNLEGFISICGKCAYRYIVFGTTQWSRILGDEYMMAVRREANFKTNYLQDILGGPEGSIILRVDDERTCTSPRDAVLSLLGTCEPPILLRAFEDILIPVLGLSASGKTSFINAVLGTDSLGYRSKAIQPVVVPLDVVRLHFPAWPDNKRLILVDTPGWNVFYTAADEFKHLRLLSEWFALAFSVQARLAGIIYLQDITQRRIAGSGLFYLRVLAELYGKEAYRFIVFGTTRWDDRELRSSEGLLAAMDRHEELSKSSHFWGDLIDEGARASRVDLENPWRMVSDVNPCLDTNGALLAIQREMVQLHRKFPNTKVGRCLKKHLGPRWKEAKRSM